MTTASTRKRFRLTAERFKFITAAGVLLGVLLLFASQISSGQIAPALLSALGSSLLALALVTWLSEFVFKVTFTEDLLGLIDLRDELHKSGLERIRPESTYDWAVFLGGAKEITVAVHDPDTWRHRVWPHVEREARKGGVKILLIIPEREVSLASDTSSAPSAVATLSAKLSAQDPPSAADKFERDLQIIWSDGEKGRRLTDASFLSIYRTPETPAYDVVQLTSAVCVTLKDHGYSPHQPSRDGITMQYVTVQGERSEMANWLSDGIERLIRHAGAPTYTNERTDDDDAYGADK